MAKRKVRSRNTAAPNRHPRFDARPDRPHGREHHPTQPTRSTAYRPQNGIGSHSICDQQLPAVSPGENRTLRRRYTSQGAAAECRSETTFASGANVCRILCCQHKCTF